MPDRAHIITGRCPTVFEGRCKQRGCATTKRTGLAREQEQHGDMLVVIKPDKIGELLVNHIWAPQTNT